MVVNGRVRIPLHEVELRVSRSSGPGGQHANKTESRVEAVFRVWDSEVLGPVQKKRVDGKLGPVVTAVSQDARSQHRNRELALQRLGERLADALKVERPRKPTKPSAAAKQKRLGEKRKRADVKQARRKPSADE
ncbi:MAG: aminoacyl-tRNA hydrolase [Actinobacteria bacterium]|nr:aminoacyl-tRNA hydrolase [Actinomycetota bacterium]